MSAPLQQIDFPVAEYDLDATLTSGQAFRWRRVNSRWEGVIGNRWVQLDAGEGVIRARALDPAGDWSWLKDFLQVHLDLSLVLARFPNDGPMRAAVSRCRGLRLLRQAPWECLASFLISSAKQIVQIQQIVGLLCQRFGIPVPVPPGHPPQHSFPSPERLSHCSESELRSCKMGFRARYLKETAAMVSQGGIDLDRLRTLRLADARSELMRLPGAGRKIADCVLLFAYGFQEAFPVDTWVAKALSQLYFPDQRRSLKELLRFSETYFGPFGGYAQQYLFHFMRTTKADVLQAAMSGGSAPISGADA